MDKTSIYKASVPSPIGFIGIETNEYSLLSISFEKYPVQNSLNKPGILKDVIDQLEEYFAGTRKVFNLYLKLSGTDFQKDVWKFVHKIEYGQTTNYLYIANQMGSGLKTRAVGMANSKNPIPIVIPCHRVIGSNGKLMGYSGGTERKKWLLKHELKNSHKKNLLF